MSGYAIDPTAEQTDRQLAKLHVELREHGWHRDEIAGCVAEMFGPDVTVETLTRLQMSQFIERVVTGPRWVDPRQLRLAV